MSQYDAKNAVKFAATKVWRLDEARRRVEAVQAKHPEITIFGFGHGRPRQPRLTATETAQAMAEARKDMLQPFALAEFTRAIDWLHDKPRTKSPNLKFGYTYGLKHKAEKVRGYVSNGMLIVAALDLGFVVKPEGDYSLNGHINIARIKMTGKERQPPLPLLTEVFPLDFGDQSTDPLKAWLVAP